MTRQIPTATSYRIEISGWDLNENFFVEKTSLEWSEQDGKRVFLSHRIREGAVVFVRLIHPTASGHVFPIAYQAESVVASGEERTYAVRLVQLHPRQTTEDTRGRAHAQSVEAKR